VHVVHQTLGAQIISVDNLFYVSPLLPNEATSRRAGIPILFPQFNDRGPLKKHGIARNRDWRLIKDESRDAIKSLHYSLQILPEDGPTWPHGAMLDLEYFGSSNAVDIVMRIQNTGKTEFTWAGGMHPYFAVQNILSAKLKGLQNCLVDNKYDRLQTRFNDEFKTFSQEPCESLFDSQGPLELIDSAHTLTLSATGFNQWMVWNPGKEGAKEIYDLPDEDWNRFVCIEPLVVSPANQLVPGASFTGTLRIERRSN